jgi:DNA polymerase theta
VVSFTGSSSTCPFSAADIAVCVTEKANSLLNRLISENSFMDLGLVVADELHTLADRSRGYILEMLLTKVKHLKLHRCANVQILGMSATLGNLDEMADWLGATCFTTDFRPVTLEQRVLASGSIWNHNFQKVGEYEKTFNIKVPKLISIIRPHCSLINLIAG